MEHKRRTGKKLTLQQLGALMNLDWTIIQKVETGVRAVDADFAILVVKALNGIGYDYEVNEALRRGGLPTLQGELESAGRSVEAEQFGLFALLGGAPATQNTDTSNDELNRMVDEIVRIAKSGGDPHRLIEELLGLAARDDISNATRQGLLAYIRAVRKAVADDATKDRTVRPQSAGEAAMQLASE